MTGAIDTTVLVAAIVSSEDYHAECSRLLDDGQSLFYSHGLSEGFSTLSGGRRFKIQASTASAILAEDYAPCFHLVELSAREIRFIRKVSCKSGFLATCLRHRKGTRASLPALANPC